MAGFEFSDDAYDFLCVHHCLGIRDDAFVLGWRRAVGAVRLAGPAATFHRAKNVAVTGLTMSLLMWLVAFLSVGGEWFLMWQSKSGMGRKRRFECLRWWGLCCCFWRCRILSEWSEKLDFRG